MIALGPMRVYLNYTMDRSFAMAGDDHDDDGAGFVVMSESLGSFIVLDAMDISPSVKDVVGRSDSLYFFANQVPLLELARIEGLPDQLPGLDKRAQVPAGLPTPSSTQSPMSTLRNWAAGVNLVDRPKQIIAFSDPSDILTYPMPPIANVIVANVYDRNTSRWLGLFANPAEVHTGHLRNGAVWKVLMRRRAAPRQPTPPSR